MTVLMQQVDVGKALDLLTMFKEAGKEPVLGVFQEISAGALPARRVNAVAIVDGDLHS